MEYEWGDARVSYPDWKGTFQVDQKLTGDVSIYTITKIDRDEWTIIGLDWGGGEQVDGLGHYNAHPHRLSAIVVRKDDADLDADEIRATEVMVHDVDPYDMIKAITHMAEFRMRVRRVVDSKIIIVDEGDIPEQD